MKATIKIILRKSYQTKEGKQSVCLIYTSYRRTTFIGLNISVKPEYWCEDRRIILAGEKYHLQYNKILNEKYDKAKEIIFDYYTTPLSTKAFVAELKK